MSRLELSVSSRRLPCAVCTAPLGPPRPRTSVVVVRDPSLNRMAVRLAHVGCARSEVRLGGLGDCGAGNPMPGHEWNLIRRTHREVGAVLAWESRPGFDGPVGALSRPSAVDLVARGLRRSGFTPASGSLSRLVPAPACGLRIARVGRDLVLFRDRRRWLEFSDAAAHDGSDAWLADAARGGRVLLLYGPGLGGEALEAGSLTRALESETALCATVRVQEPHARGTCGGRWLGSAVAADSTQRRPHGARRLA
ncbi:MAG TPA: hypothetical protein VF712_06490 [Thermoleophilaceae bacterium]